MAWCPQLSLAPVARCPVAQSHPVHHHLHSGLCRTMALLSHELSLPLVSPHVPRVPRDSLGAPQSTQSEFPRALRMAWMATASLWLSMRACRDTGVSGAGGDTGTLPAPRQGPTLFLLLSQHCRLARIWLSMA